MKPCELTITTNVDGQENTIVRKGEIELSSSVVRIRYREENAIVDVRLQGETANVERQGDYTLKLCLERGKITNGEIGIGGAGGAIQTVTHKVAYSVTERSLLLSLQYDLVIGGEVQKMSLRILGRVQA